MSSLTYHYLTPSGDAPSSPNTSHYYKEPSSKYGQVYSYLHPQQSNGSLCPRFYFDLDGIEEEVSLLPVRKINQLAVTFTLGIKKEPAICYQGKLISSISEALKTFVFPSRLDQSLLNTIATIINYISQGTTFTYIEDSAMIKGEGIEFEVISRSHHFQANLSSLASDCKLTYCQKNIE